MRQVVVFGGGAAGMLAAITAAEHGAEVILIEKNEKLGKKIYITGKGRCNVTNTCDRDEFFRKVVTNQRFLFSSFFAFSNEDTVRFFEESGVPIKIERGERAFPVSDKSSDIISGLTGRLKRAGVKVKLMTTVKKIIAEDGMVSGVVTDKGIFSCDACILATGGLSYPSTGSTGDGYSFAGILGHTIQPCFPSLTALKTKESFPKDLMGLSLKNVVLTAYVGTKEVFHELGELLFTEDGVSGPLVLSASSILAAQIASGSCSIALDLKPGLSKEELDVRLLKDFDEMKNKQFQNALGKLLPQRIIQVIISLCGISPEKQVNSITREERTGLIKTIKSMRMQIRASGGYSEAVITKGGITTTEVKPSTMESKLVKGLYFAGEVLDVDAMTGGFNLQIAWSTGFLAGKSAAEG